MKLNNIFAKSVDRKIDGVIKADDLRQLHLEVDEYVLTNEIEVRLGDFLDAYNNYDNANGVWISGFFGSGKSHLLKMLAILLENNQTLGFDALEIFLAKCNSSLLAAELKKACRIPSRSILFNIDQKADIVSKKDFDALLAVFVKVFDEMCGYYGNQAYIAQFERDLDSRGLYKSFKDIFQNIAEISWEEGREDNLFEADNITKAFAEVTGASLESSIGILDKYREDYALSIEDFAKQVNDFIEQQEPDFRLNFFVDEVGQYIADNVKLMTNLQTVAESLATKCHGRAWIIVTAQDDMATVFGEEGKQQSNDFSKIQARFANRLKLTSQNVEEVIQKRLLKKNDDGQEMINELYHQHKNNLKTLFDFADGAQTYRNFKDCEHFIDSYPFVPYQFSLFQNAIKSLSDHNAFEGRHSSVGERSMLGVFQQVAMQISDQKVGDLATFDLMYEGIRLALKTNSQNLIGQAEKNLGNDFAVKLLKILFLVKYVKGFKATIRNLSILLRSSFDCNIGALVKNVETALKLLEQQSYIQRNGDLYEYLTNEEKDVEEEIKQTEIDGGQISSQLAKIIFDRVIKTNKIRFKNNQDYPFTRKLDGKALGHEQELAINIISPASEYNDEYTVKSHSLGKAELTVLMEKSDRIYSELMKYLQTDKYVRYSNNTAMPQSKGRIIAEQGRLNSERFKRLEVEIADCIGKSTLFVSGDRMDIAGDNAQTRVIKGFHELISRIYSHLRMLEGSNYREDAVQKYLNDSQDTLYADAPIDLSEAEQELFNYIQRNQQNGLRTTVKSLRDIFEKKPYGWHLGAILCITAKLYARGKIEISSDSQTLTDTELCRALRNSVQHNNLVVKPQAVFTNSQIKRTQEFYEEFFDRKSSVKEPKALGNDIINALDEKINRLEKIYVQEEKYPFVNVLGEIIKDLKSYKNKPYTFFFGDIAEFEDKLLDLKDDLLDPIMRFINSSSCTIYDETRKFLSEQKNNLDYIPAEQMYEITALMQADEVFKGKTIKLIKSTRDVLATEISKILERVLTSSKQKLAVMLEKISSMDEFSKLTDEQQQQISSKFDNVENRIEFEQVIAVVNDTVRRFEEITYPELLDQVILWAQPKKPEVKSCSGSNAAAKTEKPKVQVKQAVAATAIDVDFNKPFLNNEAEVEEYIAKLKQSMIETLKSGKRIRI